MNDTNGNAAGEDQVRAVQVRASYSTPSFRVLGTLAELTATGSKSGKENNGNKTGNKP